MNLEKFALHFELVLDGYIQKKVDNTIDIYGDGLIPALEYLYEYNQGGKAIRPYMVYLTYKLCGGEDDAHSLMQVGLINELIHLFALIHDDIADQGLTRRHRPTYHIQLRNVYDDSHIGDSQALLVGDLVYSRAVQDTLELENTQARMIIGEMIQKVIMGELLDVHYSFIESEMSSEAIAIKDDLKSGQYTFTAPMLLGATLAGSDDNTKKALNKIGKLLGVAFQMRDDLLDWLPNDDGKTKLSDIHEGNQTVVWQYLLGHADDKDADRLRHLRRKKLSPDDRNRIQQIVERYDLKLHIGTRINSDLQKASEMIHQQNRPQEYVGLLLSLIDFLKISLN